MYNERLMKIAEYVAMQCSGCSDSPQILTYKAVKVMKYAIEKHGNPYKALNNVLLTDVSEKTLWNL